MESTSINKGVLNFYLLSWLVCEAAELSVEVIPGDLLCRNVYWYREPVPGHNSTRTGR